MTLAGKLDLPYQHVEAQQRVEQLAGVVQVDNQIVLEGTPKTEADLRMKVNRAFQRHSELDASRIAVEVHANQVRLIGTVSSYIQRRIAENSAWAAPGVSDVVDLLRLTH